jgi:hypothetical protein
MYTGGYSSKNLVRALMIKQDCEFEHVADMLKARRGHTMLNVGNLVYVVAGNGPLASREHFDVAANAWTELPDMLKPRSWTGLAWFEKLLYICGFGDAHIESYNPIT